MKAFNGAALLLVLALVVFLGYHALDWLTTRAEAKAYNEKFLREHRRRQ